MHADFTLFLFKSKLGSVHLFGTKVVHNSLPDSGEDLDDALAGLFGLGFRSIRLGLLSLGRAC